MTSFQRTLVTAALPYANGPKHIGHIAGAYLPADIYTRFLRNAGEEVLFVCGSDEHGTAIPIEAQKENTTAQAIIDRYHALLKHNFEQFGIAFDDYHRTSHATHHETASEFFKTLYDKGLFVEERSEQYFDEAQQTFLADRYIKGTCPNCQYPGAFGDQCEKCGKSLSPDESILFQLYLIQFRLKRKQNIGIYHFKIMNLG
jgi:methionyl-tRNA synthetase